ARLTVEKYLHPTRSKLLLPDFGSWRGTYWSMTNAARPVNRLRALRVSVWEEAPLLCVSLERAPRDTDPRRAPRTPRASAPSRNLALCALAPHPARVGNALHTHSHKRETAMRRPLILSLCALLAPALAPASAPAQGRPGAEGHATVPPLAPFVAAPASELRDVVERYATDRAVLLRRYDA